MERNKGARAPSPTRDARAGRKAAGGFRGCRFLRPWGTPPPDCVPASPAVSDGFHLHAEQAVRRKEVERVGDAAGGGRRGAGECGARLSGRASGALDCKGAWEQAERRADARTRWEKRSGRSSGRDRERERQRKTRFINSLSFSLFLSLSSLSSLSLSLSLSLFSGFKATLRSTARLLHPA